MFVVPYISSKPRWCVVRFIEENVVHVNDDASRDGHWITACGVSIMEHEYTRAHPQMVTCLACIVVMGTDSLWLC